MRTEKGTEAPITRDGESKAFAQKFVSVPSILRTWMEPYGGLAGKRVLDFGCGEGITACALAASDGADLVAGTDINTEATSCLARVRSGAGLNALPSNLLFETIRPGEICSQTGFDFVYSWSVFEHIDRDLIASVLASLRERVAKEGYLFIQISPLYYSAEGAHLWELGYYQWEHLTKQLSHIHDALQSLGPKRAADLWSMFSRLNRITANELVTLVVATGFREVRQYRTKTGKKAPDVLKSILHEEILETEQVVILVQKV